MNITNNHIAASQSTIYNQNPTSSKKGISSNDSIERMLEDYKNSQEKVTLRNKVKVKIKNDESKHSQGCFGGMVSTLREGAMRYVEIVTGAKRENWGRK